MAKKSKKPVVHREELTQKQKAFVSELLRNNGNGTRAALFAYDTEDYGTANEISRGNLQNPVIKKLVDEGFEKINQGITWERVLREMGKLAFQDDKDSSSIQGIKTKNLENIGKFMGKFVERQQVDVHLHAPVVYAPKPLPEGYEDGSEVEIS